MPRFLVLMVFLAMCCTAFVAGNVYAEESATSTQKFKAPQDSLASLLKTAHKKGSTDTKLSSSKKTPKLKTASSKKKMTKKLTSSKKTAKKPALSKKSAKKVTHAYGKSKQPKKSAKKKVKTARGSL
jgi:hypothetical protein